MIKPICPKCDDDVMLCGDCMFAEINAEAASLPVLSPHLTALLRGARGYLPTAEEQATQRVMIVRDLMLRCRHGHGEFQHCAACCNEAQGQQEARACPGHGSGNRTGRQKCPSTKSA